MLGLDFRNLYRFHREFLSHNPLSWGNVYLFYRNGALSFSEILGFPFFLYILTLWSKERKEDRPGMYSSRRWGGRGCNYPA